MDQKGGSGVLADKHTRLSPAQAGLTVIVRGVRFKGRGYEGNFECVPSL